jgi:hypothetical protein
VSSRKGHNSFLFLTTLGVYLGLVLVGGTAPQTFAHSATTRHFEISDEIEFGDELDNKPDGEVSSLADSVGVYFQDIEMFLSGLRRLSGGGKFDPSVDAFEVAQSTLLPCVKDNRVGSYTAEKFVSRNQNLRPSLEFLSKRLTDGYSLADCVANGHFGGQETASSHFNFKLEGSAFTVEVRVGKASPQLAASLVAPLGETFRQLAAANTDPVRQKIYENTTFRAENDQVFIVTRLARGSLDPLIAKDAK